MKYLELGLKTLTPVWTGDIDRDSAIIMEAGIIGSLRWWYEGIVRGLGAYACDPTSEEPKERCKFNTDGYENALKEGKSTKDALMAGLRDVCPACFRFGCTGWRKGFRIEINGLNTLPLFFVTHENVYLTNGGWLSRIFGGKQQGKGKNRRFYFSQSTLWNPEHFSVKIIPLDEFEQENFNILSYLFEIITIYGGIGAKNQNGFGQVRIVNGLDRDSAHKGKALIKKDVERFAEDIKSNGETFNLADFFSILFQIKDPVPYARVDRLIGDPPKGFNYRNHFIPCAFDIRYKSRARNPFTGEGHDFGLRPFFKKKFKREIVDLLFGGTDVRSDRERSASRIYVSHLYKDSPQDKYHLKIWGHVPSSSGIDRKEVTAIIKDFICGSKGMFPGSIVKLEFKKEEFLK